MADDRRSSNFALSDRSINFEESLEMEKYQLVWRQKLLVRWLARMSKSALQSNESENCNSCLKEKQSIAAK